MNAFVTVDVEHDCPPFRTSYRGIEEGLPKLTVLLKQKNLRGTFFATGDVARRYPAAIQALVDDGHEIGCHGNTHARFDRMSKAEATVEIRAATETLRQFYPVVSFRAPNLQFPRSLIKLLVDHGYRIDSSQGRHKRPWLRVHQESGITRIPVSTTSLTLRLSPPLRNFLLHHMKDPVVLMVHPWEFVDLRQEALRLDCRWRTGPYSLQALSETIDLLHDRGAQFKPLSDYI